MGAVMKVTSKQLKTKKHSTANNVQLMPVVTNNLRSNEMFKKNITEIEHTFSMSQKPVIGELFLTKSFPLDSEYDHIRNFFNQFNDWRQITRERMKQYIGDEIAILCFLSPVAFRYYLPAFLIAALENIFEEKSFVLALNIGLTLHKPTKNFEPSSVQIRFEQFNVLTLQEKLAVKHYLQVVAELEIGDELGAETALHSYWYDFIEPVKNSV